MNNSVNGSDNPKAGESMTYESEILIVDDSPQQLTLFEGMLKDDPFHVHVATNPEEMFDVLEKEIIDIILLDLMLGTQDSSQLCTTIRKRMNGRPVQIVFISGRGDPMSVVSAMEQGGDDFIRKPVTKQELRARISAAVIRFRKQMDLYREREYFRMAVIQEERLTQAVVDKHINLKNVFQDMKQRAQNLARAKKSLERMLEVDSLTKLLSRQALFHLMDYEIEQARTSEVALSGIMLDLDHFKTINDEYGHLVGDQALAAVGSALKSSLRKKDAAGRYGGEEFFVVLPSCDEDTAIVIAERFRLAVENIILKNGAEKIPVTASLGVAEFRFFETREQWIARADKAMYQAKACGRNQVVAG